MSPYLAPDAAQVLRSQWQSHFRYRRRFSFYHRDTEEFIKRQVHPESRVLLVGHHVVPIAQSLNCASVTVLELAIPDLEPGAADHWTLISTLESAGGTFDYIFLPYTLQLVSDIQSFLGDLRKVCDSQTRVVVLQYNFIWAPLIRAAQWLGLAAPMPVLNWLNVWDVQTLLLLTRFITVRVSGRCLIPFGIPLLSPWINKVFSPIPALQWLCQKTIVMGRLQPSVRETPSLSIVVPARNEAGNIAALVDRLPLMTPLCEVIFVEGHSSDQTWQEIQRVTATHSRKDLFSFITLQQPGIGKADAVRLGFSKASGDVLMILDADLSVQPEDLPNFYVPYQEGVAEFLNGSRLVYRMEDRAMQLLNLFFNKLFAVLLSWMIGQQIKDSLCGTKVISRKNYLRIREHFSELGRTDPFSDFELLLGASALNLQIADVPVRYKERVYGSTNISRFKNGWQLLRLILTHWGPLNR